MATQGQMTSRWWEHEALQLLKSTKKVDDVVHVLRYVPIPVRERATAYLADQDRETLSRFYELIFPGRKVFNETKVSIAEAIYNKLILPNASLVDDAVYDRSKLTEMSVEQLNENIQDRFSKIPLTIWIREALGHRPRAVQDLYNMANAAITSKRIPTEQPSSNIHPLTMWVLTYTQPHPQSALQQLLQPIRNIFNTKVHTMERGRLLYEALVLLRVLEFRLTNFNKEPHASHWRQFASDFRFVFFCQDNGAVDRVAVDLIKETFLLLKSLSLEDVETKTHRYHQCCYAWNETCMNIVECIWLDEESMSRLRLLLETLDKKNDLFSSSAIVSGVCAHAMHGRLVTMKASHDIPMQQVYGEELVRVLTTRRAALPNPMPFMQPRSMLSDIERLQCAGLFMRQISDYVIDVANGKNGIGLPEVAAKHSPPKLDITTASVVSTEDVSKPLKPKKSLTRIFSAFGMRKDEPEG